MKCWISLLKFSFIVWSSFASTFPTGNNKYSLFNPIKLFNIFASLNFWDWQFDLRNIHFRKNITYEDRVLPTIQKIWYMKIEYYLPSRTLRHPNYIGQLFFEVSIPSSSKGHTVEQCQARQQFRCWGRQPHMSKHLYDCQESQSDRALLIPLSQQKHHGFSLPFSPPRKQNKKIWNQEYYLEKVKSLSINKQTNKMQS